MLCSLVRRAGGAYVQGCCALNDERDSRSAMCFRQMWRELVIHRPGKCFA